MIVTLLHDSVCEELRLGEHRYRVTGTILPALQSTANWVVSREWLTMNHQPTIHSSFKRDNVSRKLPPGNALFFE